MWDLSLPTSILSEEHKSILTLLDIVDSKISSKWTEIEKDFLQKVLYFIKNYADNFHHAKEEDIFFVELNKASENMHCNPIPQMLHEHDLGRLYVKNIEEWIEEDSKEKIIENIINYSQLLREHIYKEDNILYPMANNALSEESQKEILTTFSEIDKKNDEIREKSLSILLELNK